VLDDRLDGKDLEWARDHLRRCETCRERVEDFREMLLRVGRLPSAAVGAAAMDQAFALSIPERLRSQGAGRSFEVAPPLPAPAAPIPQELSQPVRPEVSSIPDLLTELEREIFRDEPMQDHPMPLSPVPEPLYPTMAAAHEEVEPFEAAPADPVPPAEAVAPLAPFDAAPLDEAAELAPTEPAHPEILSGPLREVPVDSHRDVQFTDWEPYPEPAPALEAAAAPLPAPSNVVFDQEPAQRIDDEREAAALATPPRKPDTAMRIAVGLGAAACVLLAAVLYEGGLLKSPPKASATAATASASVHPSASARPSVSPSASAAASASALPSTSTAPVLYTLGNGVGGGTMFRIRPGTAVSSYTRLVFDMHGSGLPTMIVSRPDDLHVAVTFRDTNVAGAPVNGIRSYQVTAVEPGVQQGADGIITIDLARPVRVTAFTLPATAGYAWRLVVDLHTN
jgi:hypothetical protein